MAPQCETTSKLLQIAVSLAGRERTLAALACSEALFESYARGEADFTLEHLGNVIGLILAEQSASIAKYQERLSKLRKDRSLGVG
ncbi:MAG TPA: hypothetical protein VHN19_15935 [Burkholderiales bacterium]|nr:hypothetical protein [Burkholderiales bacterium]